VATPTLIWTALPAGLAERDGRRIARISVFLSPRLDGEAAMTLSDVDALVDWPSTLRRSGPRGLALTVDLRSGSQPVGSTTVLPLASRAGRDGPDSRAWRNLFPGSTPIAPTKNLLGSRTSSVLHSYPAGQLARDIRALYAQTLTACVNGTPGPNLESFTRDAVRASGRPPVNMAALEAFARFHTSSGRTLDRAGLRARAAVRPDFHEIVASLGTYPLLLRRLGLVLDIEVSVDDLGLKTGLTDLRLRVGPGELAHEGALHHYRPWSAVAFSSARDGGSAAFTMAPSPPGPSLASLRLDDAQTTVVQERLEHVAYALIHAGRRASMNAARMAPGEHPPEAHLPALVQGGIRLTHAAAPAMTSRAMETQARLLEDLTETRQRLASTTADEDARTADDGEDTRLLDADDVLRGYRVDVRDVDEGTWRSLCRRRTRYRAGDWAWPPEDGHLEDEGFLEPMVYDDEGAEREDSRVLEDLFEWDGWSLVVPRDSAQRRRFVAEQDAEAATAGTPLQVRSEVPPGSLMPQRFGRHYEFRLRKVNLAGNDVAATPGAGSAGATVSETIPCLRVESVKAPVVIPATARGYNEGGDVVVLRDADLAQHRTGEFRLHVLPPEVSLSLAEKHGVFDGYSNDDAWTLLSNHRGSTEEIGLEETVTAAPCYAPYLPDPLVKQAVLCLPDGAGHVDLPRFDDIPEAERGRRLARSCLLVIRPGGDRVRASVKGREVTLTIPRGRVQKLRLAARLTPDELALLSQAAASRDTASRDARFNDALLLRAQRGELPPLAPSETLTVAFATQRPLSAPAFGRPLIQPRSAASTTALFADDALRFDRPSTGRIDVYARWEDPVDDPSEDGWSVAVNRLHAGGVAIDEDGGKPLDPAELDDAARSPLAHDFGDTRHREVTYRAVATSRFAAFYPPDVTADADSISLASDTVTLRVPATAPPDEADIAYVIPTIGRAGDDTRATVGERRITTRGDGLRIYMNRGWFSSGRGEQLALVLARDDTQGLDVCEWGENPLRLGAPLPESLRLEHLWGGAGRIDHHEVEGRACSLLVLDVHFSDEHRLPFADVEFLSQRAYLPMVRLAVARYQREAIDGCQLSGITRADFAPLTPGRSLTVKQTGSDRWYLAVRGYSYGLRDAGRSGDTTRMLATIEVLPRDAGGDAIAWRQITAPVRLDAQSDEPWRYLWSAAIRIDDPDYLSNTWRRRLVVEEVDPFSGDSTTEGARLVTLHTVEL